MIQRATRAADQAEQSWTRQKGDAQDGFAEEPAYGLPETIARAVIAEMKEPDDLMKATEEVHWGYSCHVCGGLKEGWQLMIDTALKEDNANV